MFNSYFSNIGVELNKNIPFSNKNIYKNITSNKSSIFIKPCNFYKVIILYKKEIKNDCSNYRPISLTSQFSKIFEKILKVRMFSFLDKNSLIKNSQFGFQNLYQHVML